MISYEWKEQEGQVKLTPEGESAVAVSLAGAETSQPMSTNAARSRSVKTSKLLPESKLTGSIRTGRDSPCSTPKEPKRGLVNEVRKWLPSAGGAEPKDAVAAGPKKVPSEDMRLSQASEGPSPRT